MTDKKRDYDVGYGKPPKHSQFQPGQSGFKGRKHKRRETQAEIIHRLMFTLQLVQDPRTGKRVRMTLFELLVRGACQRAGKSGTAREITAIINLCDRYRVEEVDTRRAEAEEGGRQVLEKIITMFDRTVTDDPPEPRGFKPMTDERVRDILKAHETSTPAAGQRAAKRVVFDPFFPPDDSEEPGKTS